MPSTAGAALAFAAVTVPLNARAAEAAAPSADTVSPSPDGYPPRGLAIAPAGPGKGNTRWAIGGVWQITPLFTASYQRGLGSGFSADAHVETIVLYNQLGIGAQWATRAGPFSLGVMAHLAGYFGALGKALVGTTQFDATGRGLLLDPGAKGGLQLTRDSWLTMQFEQYLSLHQWQKFGTLTVSPNAPADFGWGLSLVVEYTPMHQGVLYYGASLNHTAANFPMWMNVEATPDSPELSSAKITYLGVLAGYEF
jgi:hypothetical protein